MPVQRTPEHVAPTYSLESEGYLLQVKEIALLLEEQLGLIKGWLLATPCKVGASAFPVTPVCGRDLRLGEHA